MNIVDCIQGSPEWKAARCGRLTASRCGDMMARTKSGPGASRGAYLAELVIERLTGAPLDHFVSQAMRDGTERQPEALRLYSFGCLEDISEVGFVLHPAIENFGASPDGLVGAHGLVEIKCPEPKQHLATLLGEPPKKEYVDQMMAQMAVTGRYWCDFVSYSPLFPPEMQLHKTHFTINPDLVKALEREALNFLAELHETVTTLRGRYPNGRDPIHTSATGDGAGR
jgi:hypothetical protein